VFQKGALNVHPIFTLADATSVISGAIVGIAVGAVAAYVVMKFFGLQALSNAKQSADELIRKARDEAETLRKQIELDGRNELAQRRYPEQEH
jgi:F0F1-type ATP synthase membrane subunit b/b'